MDMIMHKEFMDCPAVAKNKVLTILDVIDFTKLKDMVEPEIRSKSGRAGFPVDSMLKATFLGNYYDLSDRNLEVELQDRVSFRLFCGMYNASDFPDHSTLCNFRNDLVDAKMLEPVFDEINAQLEAQDLKIKEGSIVIVDATVIQSAARPMKKPKESEVQEVSADSEEQPVQRELSKDPDATFSRKGDNSTLGYKGYLATDEEGYGEKVVVRPANESEQINFDKIADPTYFEGRRVYADKGSASRKNRDYLKENKMKSGIMHKASRNNPLRHSQKIFNKLISKKRWRVEQSFGILKRRFKSSRARYITLAKVSAQLIWKTICMNALKASNKLAKQGV